MPKRPVRLRTGWPTSPAFTPSRPPRRTSKRDDAQALDKFYIAPRYPDALGGGDVRTAYKVDEALLAIERAERVLAFVRDALSAERESHDE